MTRVVWTIAVAVLMTSAVYGQEVESKDLGTPGTATPAKRSAEQPDTLPPDNTQKTEPTPAPPPKPASNPAPATQPQPPAASTPTAPAPAPSTPAPKAAPGAGHRVAAFWVIVPGN